MRICFFANMSAHANWREMFERVEFYSVDIKLLRELGHEVVEAGLPSLIDWKADLYYGWWWGHAPFVTSPRTIAATTRTLISRPGRFAGLTTWVMCRCRKR